MGGSPRGAAVGDPMRARPTYDEKLLQILRDASEVFALKGYHRASVRDISAATGVSLAGLYYYFRSKEELLFLIQDHCFGTLLDRLEQDLSGVLEPEDRLRIFVRNHLLFFLNNRDEMKVLSHEATVLTGDFRAMIAEKKRRYSDTLHEILAEIRPDDPAVLRASTFALFGMMNWIYTWHRPGRDLDEEGLINETLHLFLHGFARCRDPGEDTAVSEDSLEGMPSIWRTT